MGVGVHGIATKRVPRPDLYHESGRRGSVLHASVTFVFVSGLLVIVLAGDVSSASETPFSSRNPRRTPDSFLIQARADSKANHFSQSDQNYRRFIHWFPGHPSVPLALIELADLRANEHRNESAMEALYYLVDHYPLSQQAPDGWLRLSRLLAVQGERRTALSCLELLIRRYPLSSQIEPALKMRTEMLPSRSSRISDNATDNLSVLHPAFLFTLQLFQQWKSGPAQNAPASAWAQHRRRLVEGLDQIPDYRLPPFGWNRKTLEPREEYYASLNFASMPYEEWERRKAISEQRQQMVNLYAVTLDVVVQQVIQRQGSGSARALLWDEVGEYRLPEPVRDHARKLLANVDKAIIASYLADAKRAMEEKNWQEAKRLYKLLISEYPGSEPARFAEAQMKVVVQQLVIEYHRHGDVAYRPRLEIGKPQSKARDYFQKMCEEDPTGEISGQADYALLMWAKALGTERKENEGIAKFQQLLDQFPESKYAADAAYQIGFYYGATRRFKDALPWMKRVYEDYPDSEKAPEALFHAAVFLQWLGQPFDGIPLYQRLIDKYPESKGAQWARKEIEGLKNSKKEGE